MNNIHVLFKNERLRLGYEQKDLAKELNLGQTQISKIENGKSSVTIETIDKMMELGADFSSYFSRNKSNIIPEEQGVPYYEDIDVAATVTGMYSDSGEKPSFFINYRDFNDCTAYLPVVGDSMYPKYASGEVIAVKQIFNLDVVLWGEAYLVVTNSNANDLRTVKLLFQHEDNSKVILKASNPNFKGDTIINKEDILSIFLIKGKIVRNQL